MDDHVGQMRDTAAWLQDFRARWSRNQGHGFSKIKEPNSLLLLLAQIRAFMNLVDRLDASTENPAMSTEVQQDAADIVNDLTMPGSASPEGLATHDEGEPRQASIGGAGAHPEDLVDIATVIAMAKSLPLVHCCLSTYNSQRAETSLSRY